MLNSSNLSQFEPNMDDSNLIQSNLNSTPAYPISSHFEFTKSQPDMNESNLILVSNQK